jgi:hypothetical protein
LAVEVPARLSPWLAELDVAAVAELAELCVPELPGVDGLPDGGFPLPLSPPVEPLLPGLYLLR